MIYVYRPKSSVSARLLSKALQARRVFGTDQFRPTSADTVVAWGAKYEPQAGESVLNGGEVRSKFTDAVKLREAGIPTVQVAKTQPPVQPANPANDPAVAIFEEAKETAEEFSQLRTFQRGEPFDAAISEVVVILNRLQSILAQPLASAERWLARMNDHVGGADLLNTPQRPDYFSRFEDIAEEYRVHSFDGRSIRAGRKIHRLEFVNNPNNIPHPWIRSYDGGWSISYDNFESTPSMRELARSATEALGLDFGAVDIGRKADGSLLVLEVNRAPGLDGNTITAYADAVQRWISE